MNTIRFGDSDTDSPGYRSVILHNVHGEELELAALLVHVDKRPWEAYDSCNRQDQNNQRESELQKVSSSSVYTQAFFVGLQPNDIAPFISLLFIFIRLTGLRGHRLRGSLLTSVKDFYHILSSSRSHSQYMPSLLCACSIDCNRFFSESN
jgi:hypothetical protein